MLEDFKISHAEAGFPFDHWQKLEIMIYKGLNMDFFFFYKNASIRFRRPLLTPEVCEALFFFSFFFFLGVQR